jgi:hypothetical protein
MADIRLNLVVSSDGSLDRETVKATKLANELERAGRAARLAARVGGGAPPGSGGSGGGSGGPAGGGGSGGGGAAGAAGNAERSGYRQFRGNTGSGAEARDFAKQAEGLGGLVRVYATFAANIYALTTAFNALSKATDTANMVKGLDQLGAASGKNLGNLTKQLVAASDGAISLKDAMTATAQATSGGLSGEQLLRLTAVAKNASQALGRDMPDALSRLTRGITKIEPELLDELGILVKVDAANVEYARSLGKTATSLTDLERRQAFANAAISQGEQKFKDIAINSNPYAKIAASMANITQSGLTLVNKVLTPVVELLSTNPIALSATLAAISALLLKQAIPALGQWRAGLKASAEASREAATKINEDFKKFQRDSINRNQPLLASQLATQEAAIAASRNAMNQEAINSGRKLTAGMREVMGTPIAQINQAQLDRLSREEAALRTRAARFAQEAVDPQRSAASQASRAAQSSDILSRAENTKKYTEQVRAAQAAERALTADRLRGEQQLLASQTRFGESRQRQVTADRALNAAARAEILSNVAQNTQVMGMAGAYAKLAEETKKARMEAVAAGRSFSGVAAAGTMVRGTFAIATSAVSSFMGAFMPWIMAIGLATAAIGALVQWLGSNNKELKEFKSGVENLNSSTDMMGKTIDAINKKPFLEQLTIESLKARSSALSDLASNVGKSYDNLFKADAMASEFDKFIDGWKILWGGDLRSVATKGIASALAAGFKGATDGPAREKYKKAIEDITGSKDLSAKGIVQSLDASGDPQDVLVMLDKLKLAQETFAKETEKATAPLVEFSSALADAGKNANTLIAGLNLTDPLAKLGNSVLNLSVSLAKMIESGPINSVVALKKIIDTPSESGFLPTNIYSNLLKLKNSVDSVHESLTRNGAEVDTNREKLEKLVKANKDLGDAPGNRSGKSTSSQAQIAGKAQENALRAEIAAKEASMEKARKAEKELSLELNNIQKALFDYGANAISLSLKNAGTQAALSISKAASSNLSGEGTAQAAYNLGLAEIAIQKEVINGQMNVAKAMFLNSQALERSTAQSKLNTIELKIQNLTETDPAKFDKEMGKLDLEKKMVEKSIGVLDSTVKYVTTNKSSSTLLKATKEESPEVRQSVMAYAAPLAGGEAQMTALNAQAQIKANELVIGKLREQSAIKAKIYEDSQKEVTLATAANDKARELFEITQAQRDENAVNLEFTSRFIENQKAELALETELSVLKIAKNQTGKAAAQSAEEIARRETDLSLVRINNENALNTIRDTGAKKAIETLRVQADAVERAKIESSAAYGASPEDIQSKLANLDLEELKRKKVTAAEIEAFTVKQAAIEYTAKYTSAVRELGFELERVNELNTRTTSLADTMAKAFGKVGTALGGVAKAFSQSAVERVKIEEKLLQDTKKLDSKYKGDKEKITKETVKLEKVAAIDRQKADVDSYASMAGAAKGFFSEKTVAFKAFAAIEQVLTLQSMALQISALAVDTSTTAGYVANTLVRIGSSIKGAIAKALDNVFPYNLIAAGIVVAAAASFGLFGGGGSVPNAPSSEDLQKVQGTGQKYNSKGELESTGYGTLGDDTAKSESLVKSMELLSEYAFEELEYSNKMLTALQNIEKSMTGVSKGLYLTQGLISGSAFGTQVGQSISKNLFTTLFGGGKLATSIFGGKKTTSITGSGIEVTGSLGQLASGGGAANQYETGSTTKSGGLFRSDKTTNFRNLTSLGASVKDSLAITFKSIREGLLEVGTSLGLGAQELANTINGIPIKMSVELRNLKGKELEEAVSAVLSATMDEITEKTLSIVKPYQQMGEGLAETAFRLANDSRVIDLQLKSIGMAFNLIGITSIAPKQRLLDISGGLEEFTSAANFFKDNFLSEAEQLIPIQKAVTDELARLGLAGLDSRDKFKMLVTSLDLTKESDQNLYVSLMKLEKGFAAVYEAAEDVSLTIKELAEAKMTQLARVMELLGDKTGLTIFQRTQELKGMDARLKPMQKWIYALEDEASARETLASAYDSESSARQTAIDGLKSSRDSLLEFSKQLALGAQSPLTPGDKYAAAQVNLSGITSILNSGTATSEQSQKALADLPGAITSLLDTSKIFNASSQAYQQDYLYAQRLLETNATKLDAQISTEQASLTALKDQVTALGVINDTAVNINDSIHELTMLMAKSDVAKLIADLASGGAASAQYSQSTTASPTRTEAEVMAPTEMYTNAINGFNQFTITMTAELQALRAEVVRLKAAADANARAVIANNTAASNNNANTVTEAVTEARLINKFDRKRNLAEYDM